MASVSGAQTSRTLLDIIPQYSKSKIEVGSVRLKSLVGVSSIQCTTSRFPKLEECAHFHYDHVDLQPIQLSLIEDDSLKGDFDGITLKVTSGHEAWQIRRSFDHFCKLDQQLHKCVFDRKFSELPVLSKLSPKTDEETRSVLRHYVSRLSAIGSGCAISCGPALSWFELDNRGRRIVAAGQGINTPAVAAAFATTPYTASATDELSFQIGDMISVIDMPPAEESIWWRGKRGFVVGFFPSNCVAVITDKIPNEIALAEPSKPVLRKHGKLIAFFRAFILSRPSRRRLKQSGILKERVFGCDLSEHLLNSGRDIPLVLKCCSEFIEAHGIVDGIYRLSGVTSNIQRLRSVFDEDRVPSLMEDTNIKQDIHSVASLLKMYFRELPNPLCTYQLYDEFVAAVQAPPEHRIERMRRTVRKLPPPHYRTLEYLMGHLGRVCGHSSGTGMTARNVAIVWAPNLLRCRSLDQGVAALQGVGVQAVVTEFLILYSPAIFGTHDINDTRPKSLAVCSPTKLLSLEEAQARGTSHRVQYVQLGDSKENSSLSETVPCYHTVIDFPRKRPALNWKTIFTPRRNHQTKSPRRFKRKTVIKSAEYLTVSGASGTSQSTNTNTHSRSVSHDSYFDTGTGDHQSCSSLVDTQHEGLSLSLDLSELQMNFDVEESEMRIFSEDETNQLFSSGISLIGSSDNLEQRFSSQELRYIDSYSPEPTDSPSDTSPRYQPLLTPSSYENLKVNNGDCVPSSQRTSASYAYEKLAESPILGEMPGESYDEESCKEVKCENDLYEGCCYEQMELGIEGYEPVSPTPTYENQDIRHPQPLDNNIYEDVQELTPSEIYNQVSYLKSSVEELNRLVSDSANDDKLDSLSSSEKKDCISIDEDDEKVEEEEVGVYQEIINSPEEVLNPSENLSLEHSHSLEPLIIEEKLPSNQILKDSCKISAAHVPDRGDNDNILEYSNGTNYEIVDFVSNKEIKQIIDNNEKNIDENKTSEMVNIDNTKCDTKLSVPVNEIVDDKISSIKCEENLSTDVDRVEKSNESPGEETKKNWVEDIQHSEESSFESPERKVKEQDLDKDGRETSHGDVELQGWTEKVEGKRDWRKSPLREAMKLDLVKDGGESPVKETRKREWTSSEGDSPAREERKLVWGKGDRGSPIETGKRDWRTYVDSNGDSPVGEAAAKRDWSLEENKREGERRLCESDAERRERIERYKEERRTFFRQKYGGTAAGEEDDELIRRIRQRTHRPGEPRSPTKTTVSISYSPARVPSLISPTSPEKKEQVGFP